MLKLVDEGPRSLEDYRKIAPDHILDALLAVAKDLKGARVAHINATPYGGGVSELLRSAVPITNDLGRPSLCCSRSLFLQPLYLHGARAGLIP